MNRDDENNKRSTGPTWDAVRGQSQLPRCSAAHGEIGNSNNMNLASSVSDRQGDRWKIKGLSGTVTAVINSLSDPKGTWEG